MAVGSGSVEGDKSVASPRLVSRGAKMQLGFLGLDSLYLMIEYPRRDMFDYWSYGIDLKDPRLKNGILREDKVLRFGANGYRLSLWDEDARLFLTPRVNDELADTPQAGQGMGLMLQLGPKWLRMFGDVTAIRALRTNIFEQLKWFGLETPELYLMRINRADIALDIVGMDVKEQSIEEWRQQWVGYAKRKHFYDSDENGDLEGFAIGSSEGVVRFKVYDKIADTVRRNSGGFWRSVWAMDEDCTLPVTRFEWSIRCYEGKFAGLRYLSDLSYDGFLELLNYVTLKWGQLRIPNPDDPTKTRWKMAPLWADLRGFIDYWSYNCDGLAQREYDFSIEVNHHYLRSIIGWLAGLQVRVGLEQHLDQPATLNQALRYLDEMGYPMAMIEHKARQKWEVAARLNGVRSDE
ncbi:MAG TPA: hypothetical protein PKD09_11030 [Aggregatilinea sp.]|uniref:hypothetical protein n=1 Tax=Aggregatilinea sp. TaxID=2806333 RepID=UPI002CB97119|nr:hypothetical protein [Aggregatilinea sp.]HML22175.1 hypothetical protein [Aggregatilinea sp.]